MFCGGLLDHVYSHDKSPVALVPDDM